MFPHISCDADRTTDLRPGGKQKDNIDEVNGRAHCPMYHQFADHTDDDIQKHDDALSLLKNDQFFVCIPSHFGQLAEQRADNRPAQDLGEDLPHRHVMRSGIVERNHQHDETQDQGNIKTAPYFLVHRRTIRGGFFHRQILEAVARFG